MSETLNSKSSHPIEFGPPLEQPSFTKSISTFEPGDRIWVTKEDLSTPSEGERRVATVIGTKRSGTFTHQATILIDGASDVNSTIDFDLHHKFELASLEGQDTVWVDVKYIKPGHVVRWWGNEVVIEAAEHKGNKFFLTVTDPMDQKQKRFEYKPTDALHVKIAEPTEEKRIWRERQLAGHILPPIEIRPDESPQDFAKRIMRQMEEWTDD